MAKSKYYDEFSTLFVNAQSAAMSDQRDMNVQWLFCGNKHKCLALSRQCTLLKSKQKRKKYKNECQSHENT